LSAAIRIAVISRDLFLHRGGVAAASLGVAGEDTAR